MKNTKLDQSKLLGFKILSSGSLEKSKTKNQTDVKLGGKIGSKPVIVGSALNLKHP